MIVDMCGFGQITRSRGKEVNLTYCNRIYSPIEGNITSFKGVLSFGMNQEPLFISFYLFRPQRSQSAGSAFSGRECWRSGDLESEAVLAVE